MRIDFVATPGFFVTLTFPQSYETSPAGQYALLKAFNDRVQAHWGDVYTGLLWRKEYQLRGAPHYHCLLLLKKPVHRKLMRAYVRHKWTELTGGGLTKGNWVRTKVDELRIDAKKGAAALYHYLSSYVAKPEQAKLLDPETGELLPTGRMWGIFGELPLAEGFSIELPLEDYKIFCRRLRRWGKGRRFLKRFDINRGWTLVFMSEAVARQLVRELGEQAPDTS